MRHQKLAAAIIVTTGVLFITTCSSQPVSAPTARGTVAYDALANGASLYLTGKDLAGTRMSAQPTPLFHRCVDCHRADGSGGKRFKDGAVSADLRHAALVTHQRHPYTVPLLERAISTGVDNEDKPLDRVMPRWKLSQRDLHDVAQYVLTRLK